MRMLINAFSAGEVTPLLQGRTDLPVLSKACRVLENFIPMELGGITRRPGMLDVGACLGAEPSRLLPFQNSAADGNSFILEMADKAIRAWKTGAVPGTVGPTHVTPWGTAQLHEVQRVQANDVQFLCHESALPQILSRYSDANWTFLPFDFDFPPMRDEHTEATTITASAVNGLGITLTASAPVFDPLHVGSFWTIAHYRSTSSESLSLATNGTSAEFSITGPWEITTYGTWGGTLRLQRKAPNGTWETLFSWVSSLVSTGAGLTGDRNITAGGRNSKTETYRMEYVGTGTAAFAPRAELRAADSKITGLVKITEVTSGTVAKADVIRSLYATTATTRWSEGAWSNYRGYPRAIALHEGRLYFAGTPSDPQKIWASATGDLKNFERTGFDDASFSFQLAAQEANPILWLVSAGLGIVAGTRGDEWIIESSGQSGITALNVSAKRKSKFGSVPIQAELVGSVPLFVQRGGRRLREYVYQRDSDSWAAPDMTQLIPHRTKGGIRQIAHAQNPRSVLWVATKTGLLLSCTYERGEDVIGWAAHPTQGTVESVAATYGPGESDEVWFVTKRNGVSRIERFDPFHLERFDEASPLAKLCLLDSAVVATVAPGAMLSIPHLSGRNVSLLVNGAIQPDVRIGDNGLLPLQPATAARSIVAGLPVLPRCLPMPFDVPMDTGTSKARKWRADSVKVWLHESAALSLQHDSRSEAFPVPMRDVDHATNAPSPLYTGSRNQPLAGHHGESIDIEITCPLPLPLTVTAMVPRFQVYGE